MEQESMGQTVKKIDNLEEGLMIAMVPHSIEVAAGPGSDEMIIETSSDNSVGRKAGRDQYGNRTYSSLTFLHETKKIDFNSVPKQT
ncbi:MAG: hypothetical protein EZS28_014293 [Streblomastix strix]|uniref:Uncharacterized protein n=1 Tax=Streblomastix strix TaxID=222440 RepID=A0A5J4W5P9_9EUKA|nr:MAG: hypothetical protein EZS28_014293 [Streblomastix strix]